jgi:hypothetical protein
MGWHLKGWAEWLLNIQRGKDETVPAVALPMVKHWGRSCIGKFAARGFTKEDYGEATSPGWSYLPVWDIETQSHGSVVEIAGKRWKCLAATDSENAYPAILAYVESHVRRGLSRVIADVGRENVICCDTDGLTVPYSRKGWPAMRPDLTAPLELRRKSSWTRIRVIGPQHLERDGVRKFSGVPGSAVQLHDGRYEALVWPRLAWQIREHAGPGYRRPAHTYAIGESYASGWVDADGIVLPVEVDARPGGVNHPVPWSLTVHAASGRELGPVQAPAVLRVFGTGEKLCHHERGRLRRSGNALMGCESHGITHKGISIST